MTAWDWNSCWFSSNLLHILNLSSSKLGLLRLPAFSMAIEVILRAIEFSLEEIQTKCNKTSATSKKKRAKSTLRNLSAADILSFPSLYPWDICALSLNRFLSTQEFERGFLSKSTMISLIYHAKRIKLAWHSLRIEIRFQKGISKDSFPWKDAQKLILNWMLIYFNQRGFRFKKLIIDSKLLRNWYLKNIDRVSTHI